MTGDGAGDRAEGDGGDAGPVASTSGKFDDRDQIFQELFSLPNIDGLNVQIGTFTAGGSYSAASVRADASPIIRSDSDIHALRIVPDREIAGPEKE